MHSSLAPLYLVTGQTNSTRNCVHACHFEWCLGPIALYPIWCTTQKRNQTKDHGKKWVLGMAGRPCIKFMAFQLVTAQTKAVTEV